VKLPHIHTKDEDLDRVQHAMAKVLEPALSKGLLVEQQAQFPTIPLPDKSLAWQILGVVNIGQPTQVVICVPNSSGRYEWIVLGQSS